MTHNGSSPASVATEDGARKSDQLGSKIGFENTKSATAAQARIIKTIKVHIVAGDKAADKADQHYRSAGQWLATIKKQHAGTWDEWEELLKTRVGISTGRASELMQIADGRKTIKQLRDADAAKHRRLRDQRSSRRPEENDVSDADTRTDTKSRRQPACKASPARRPTTSPANTAPKLNVLSWLQATPEERRSFVSGVTIEALFAACPPREKTLFLDRIAAASRDDDDDGVLLTAMTELAPPTALGGAHDQQSTICRRLRRTTRDRQRRRA
jgi:hypothetical protein